MVHRAASDGRLPDGIVRGGDPLCAGVCLFDRVEVKTDRRVAGAVAEVLRRRVPFRVLTSAWWAMLSEEHEVEAAILRVLARVWDRGVHSMPDRADPDLGAVLRAAGRAKSECDKLMGLARFSDAGKFFYCEIEPECDLLTPLAEHFAARMSDCRWVMLDVRRGKAAVCENGTWVEVADNNTAGSRQAWQPPVFTEEEARQQEMWREFYHATTNQSKINYRAQMGNMPKKYWGRLVETPGVQKTRGERA